MPPTRVCRAVSLAEGELRAIAKFVEGSGLDTLSRNRVRENRGLDRRRTAPYCHSGSFWQERRVPIDSAANSAG